jgi:hypothetical protein
MWLLTSFVGRIVTAAIASTVIAALAFGAGWYRRGLACDAANLRAEIAILQADLRIANAAAADAENLAKDNEAAAADLRKQRDAYVDELKKRPQGARCLLDADDVRRLR